MAAMSRPEQFTLQTQNLGCLPIVNFFLTRIGVADHLQTYLPPWGRAVAADSGSGGRGGGAQPGGGSPPALRSR